MAILVIQIPCLNESENLASVLGEIPREIDGVDEVKILVIDDGSTDRTSQIAQEHGADRIIRFPRNRGLAVAYSTGIEAALEMGADIIVNTDGDGQYPGNAIPDLIQPILNKKADMVVGDRQTASIDYFPLYKRLLEQLGSWVVRHASNTDVPDAPSGFRALTKAAALRLNVFSDFTYTMETLIQAGRKNLAVASAPITAREVKRPSRLFRSMPQYLKMAGASILRIYAMYRPMPVFIQIGSAFMAGAFLIGVRFLYYYFHGEGDGKVQSLILAAILSILGIQTLLLALVADLIATNRKLSEEILLRIKLKDLKIDRAHKAEAFTDVTGSGRFSTPLPPSAPIDPDLKAAPISLPPKTASIEIRS